AVRLAMQAVVLVPRVVERGLVLVVTRRQRERPLPDVVARVVRQMRGGAVRLPVARAAELGLERARDRHRRRVRRVSGRGWKQHERGYGESEQPCKPIPAEVHRTTPSQTTAQLSGALQELDSRLRAKR